jgi:hypothetical protein
MSYLVNKSNTFNVTSSIGYDALTVDSDGNTVINKLVLLDDKTGSKWQIKVSDGELIAEPLELEDKREHKIRKLLNKKTSEI